MSIIKRLAVMVIISLLFSCVSQKKQEVLAADFSLGKMKVIKKEKVLDGGTEVTLVTRYELKKRIDGSLSTYFQYELGDKIKLVINNDTIKPRLSYYVPLISETEKEIDCRYLLQKKDMDKSKRIIVHDSILGFDKINISFK